MNLSKRIHVLFVLFLVFIGSFFAAFTIIYITPYACYTQRAYSIPQNTSQVDNVTGITIASTHVGPASNATNVPLDTAIIIDQARGASLENLVLVPKTKITYNITEWSDLASSRIILVPAELLQSATTYTVSAEVQNHVISWAFTTSSEPSELKYTIYLSPYVPWTALATATIATMAASFIILLRKKTQT